LQSVLTDFRYETGNSFPVGMSEGRKVGLGRVKTPQRNSPNPRLKALPIRSHNDAAGTPCPSRSHFSTSWRPRGVRRKLSVMPCPSTSRRSTPTWIRAIGCSRFRHPRLRRSHLGKHCYRGWSERSVIEKGCTGRRDRLFLRCGRDN
jgi:hypothetical protein